jgi:hypothetical protein
VRLKLDIYYTCINGGLVRSASGSAMFSTLEDGKIVEGLAGVPNEGPVLLVGYPILMGLELYSLVKRFLTVTTANQREKEQQGKRPKRAQEGGEVLVRDGIRKKGFLFLEKN